MADREDQSNLPPIPDGGLAETMPDWLRRPPAWRTLPDREVVAPEPEAATDLPEPDDSVIDPRAFLSDDDLPLWLRNLGRGRHAEPPAEGEPEMAAVPEPLPVEAASTASGGPADQPAPSRFVPATPPAPAVGAGPSSRTAPGFAPPPPRASSPAPPAWQGAWAVAVLAALLAVAIALIVVLVI